MEDILQVVRTSLESTPVVHITAPSKSHTPEILVEPEQDVWNIGEDANEMVFDDTGEGAGVEGDLDMEED